MTEAFYLPQGDDRYLPTKHTAGPWTADAQHFGPPSALLVRALENLANPHNNSLGRVSIDILGPAPLTELSITASINRPGRSVELLSAELSSADRIVARATAWRIVNSNTTEIASNDLPILPQPEELPNAGWPAVWRGGFLDAMEWRAVSGAPDERGPATVWARQRVPLVANEEPTPLQRLFVVADCGNGISGFLDPQRWWFINSELTVHIHQQPRGEWIGLSAQTIVGDHGTGTASSTLFDTRGQVGIGAQALLIRPR